MTQHLTHTIFGEDEPVRRRADLHRHRRRRPRRTKRRWLVLLLALVVIGGAGYAAFSALRPVVTGLLDQSSAEVDYPGPGEGRVDVVVKAGQTGEDIATTLRKAGVVKTRTAYLNAAQADPRRAAGIQPGTYSLLKGMRGQDAFDTLADPANRVAGTTIREGLWASETYALLSKATGVPVEDYEKAAKDAEAIGLPEQADGNVEGWLFPSTYDFAEDSTATDQLATMISMTVKVLEEAGIPQDEWQRTLTIASIVEGEVNGDADRAKVARVILNRLDDAPPNYGLLQMDSTVHFVAKERGKAGTTDAQRAVDSPYNTYKAKGLPPGPIGNPGEASIVAAANPADGDWRFFVTVDPGTGQTKFAVTQEEHERNVEEFRAWCSANPGKC